MKNRIAVIAALIIGIGCWPSRAVVMAKEADDENKSSDCLLEDYLDKNLLEMEGDDISSNSEDLLKIGENHFFEQPRNMFDVEEKETAEEDTDAVNDKENEEKEEKEDSEKLVGEKESAGDEAAASVMKNLQIPQKLDIVIDLWEMDGREQIYSEKYVIRNEGNTAGTLTLSNLACRSQGSGNVVVRPDKNGLHDDEKKSLYMEMWFEDRDCIVLSEQGTEYQAELKPGEELTIYFTGEVNEYASEDWVNGDVQVSVVYSWDVEEAVTDENVENKNGIESEENADETEEISKDIEIRDKEKADIPDNDAVKTEELGETSENGESEGSIGTEKGEESREDEKPEEAEINEGQEMSSEVEESKDSGENEELKEPAEDAINGGDHVQEKLVTSREENLFCVAEDMQTGDESVQEEAKEDRTKVIGLSEGQETKAVVDSWKVEPDHQISSAKYLIQNVGEKTGIFSLKDLVCRIKEERWIDVKTVREEVQDADGKAIYMELVLGNGDKIVLTQEKSEYRVELKPGEEITVQLVGTMNANMFENWEEENVIIDAGCSWDIEE